MTRVTSRSLTHSRRRVRRQHREGQVDTEPATLDLPDLFAIGHLAVEDLLEVFLGHLALEAKVGRAHPAPGGRLGRMLGGVVIVLGEILRRAGGGLDGSDRQHRLHPHVHVVIDLRRMIRAVMTMVVIGVALRRKPIAQFAGRLVLVAIGITAIGPAFRGMA